MTPVRLRALIAMAAAYAVLRAGGALFPGAVAAAFTGPAAHVSALFLGVEAAAGEGGVFRLGHPAMEIRVMPACSGFDFFCLASALAAGLSVLRLGGGAVRVLPRRLCAVYAVTLLANAARLVAAFHGERWLSGLLPHMSGAVHLAAGVGTFLPALLLTCSLFERNTAHDILRTAP